MCAIRNSEVKEGSFPPLPILHFHASSAEWRHFLYTRYCIGVK